MPERRSIGQRPAPAPGLRSRARSRRRAEDYYALLPSPRGRRLPARADRDAAGPRSRACRPIRLRPRGATSAGPALPRIAGAEPRAALRLGRGSARRVGPADRRGVEAGAGLRVVGADRRRGGELALRRRPAGACRDTRRERGGRPARRVRLLPLGQRPQRAARLAGRPRRGSRWTSATCAVTSPTSKPRSACGSSPPAPANGSPSCLTGASTRRSWRRWGRCT